MCSRNDDANVQTSDMVMKFLGARGCRFSGIFRPVTGAQQIRDTVSVAGHQVSGTFHTASQSFSQSASILGTHFQNACLDLAIEHIYGCHELG